jgi:hypothetical protein
MAKGASVDSTSCPRCRLTLKPFPNRGLRSSRTESDQDSRLYRVEFGVKPGTAGLNLGSSRFLVDAALPAFGRDPLEMLYRVC